jgi:hypothetical protein
VRLEKFQRAHLIHTLRIQDNPRSGALLTFHFARAVAGWLQGPWPWRSRRTRGTSISLLVQPQIEG